MQRRTRYHVTIMGNGQEEQAVVIAYSPEEMKSLVCKLYKNLIIYDMGYNQEKFRLRQQNYCKIRLRLFCPF